VKEPFLQDRVLGLGVGGILDWLEQVGSTICKALAAVRRESKTGLDSACIRTCTRTRTRTRTRTCISAPSGHNIYTTNVNVNSGLPLQDLFRPVTFTLQAPDQIIYSYSRVSHGNAPHSKAPCRSRTLTGYIMSN